jgi:hypothetical protein
MRAHRAFALALVCLAAARAEAAPAVVVVDDELRLRRGDADLALARGQPVSASGAELALVALRGETVAFQIVVVAGAQPLSSVTMALGAAPDLRAQVFRELYVPITERSHSQRRPAESLAWTPSARPADALMLGEMPDALVPIALDVRALLAGPAVPAGQLGAFWVDVYVPDAASPGLRRSPVEVSADGALLARFSLALDVKASRLPYRTVSAFAFYEADRLEARIGDGPRAEQQLWQLLHEHHIDALAPLLSAEDVARLAPAYDGSLFLPASGYDGPGAGVAPAVIAFGSYGQLGDATPEAVTRVEEMAARLPAAAADADLFVYAVDEQCKSPRAADWKQALAGRAIAGRVHVGQTCGDRPETQAADMVIVPGETISRWTPVLARAVGKRAWAYNGGLPRTGTMFLDADPRGLVANGWIAALADIQRWFYWETIFWDDGNRGGRGPVDPFVTAASFHNGDGDTNLGDGMLLYPGRQRGRYAAHSLGFPGVLPSIRLKALRRGLQDAGYLALAAASDPEAVSRIGLGAVPRLLDEAPSYEATAWEGEGRSFTPARAALRALITRAEPPSAAELRPVLEDLAARRRRDVAPALTRRGRLLKLATGLSGVVLLAGIALGLALNKRRTPTVKDPPRRAVRPV